MHYTHATVPLRRSQAVLNLVLQQRCDAHAAEPGEPCWVVVGHRAVCSNRVDSVRR